jgi:hypothetical protein
MLVQFPVAIPFGLNECERAHHFIRAWKPRWIDQSADRGGKVPNDQQQQDRGDPDNAATVISSLGQSHHASLHRSRGKTFQNVSACKDFDFFANSCQSSNPEFA